MKYLASILLSLVMTFAYGQDQDLRVFVTGGEEVDSTDVIPLNARSITLELDEALEIEGVEITLISGDQALSAVRSSGKVLGLNQFASLVRSGHKLTIMVRLKGQNQPLYRTLTYE